MFTFSEKRVIISVQNKQTFAKNRREDNDNGIYAVQILTVDSHIKRGKFVSSHLHLDCCFLFEADENEIIRIKEDENSGVKWVDIDDAPIITNEMKMKSIYKKLNDKLKLIK